MGDRRDKWYESVKKEKNEIRHEHPIKCQNDECNANRSPVYCRTCDGIFYLSINCNLHDGVNIPIGERRYCITPCGRCQ